jgi:hypothetical protein
VSVRRPPAPRPQGVPVAAPAGLESGLALVRLRQIMATPIEAWFALRPGDRALVGTGEAVVRGAPLAERLKDLRTEVVDGPAGDGAEPGSWWTGSPSRRLRRHAPSAHGELLFRSGGRWRIASGDPWEPLEAPFGGIVREVRPGVSIAVQAPARGLLGVDVIGGPASGRLEIIAPRDGQVRASEINVGAAGGILVVGASIDAEAITRARAVGVRGIVVAGLGVKERREVLASERRGQAGVHGLPPFAILVLEGAIGRPIAAPIMDILEALEGRTVAIIDEPASLVIDDREVELSEPAAGLVRVVAGPLAGSEGEWVGLAGPHRYAGGVILEAGWVQLGGRDPVAVPLSDLERYG